MVKHRLGWLVMYSKAGSKDWCEINTYDDYDHEPTDEEMQSIKDEIGDNYDITVMRYEVGDFPSPVRIIHGN